MKCCARAVVDDSHYRVTGKGVGARSPSSLPFLPLSPMPQSMQQDPVSSHPVPRYLSGMENITILTRQVAHTYLVISAIVLFTTCFIQQTPWIEIDNWHSVCPCRMQELGTGTAADHQRTPPPPPPRPPTMLRSVPCCGQTFECGYCPIHEGGGAQV